MNSVITRRATVEWDVRPTLYKTVLLRELPAALILPFSFIFKPDILNALKRYIKWVIIKCFIKRKIKRVFQKSIRNIIALNQLVKSLTSL